MDAIVMKMDEVAKYLPTQILDMRKGWCETRADMFGKAYRRPNPNVDSGLLMAGFSFPSKSQRSGLNS